MLKARGKKLGWTTALGQAAFILASRILSWQASARSAEIIRQHDLVCDAGVEIVEVPSVNVSSRIKILRRLNPGGRQRHAYYFRGGADAIRRRIHQYARRDYAEISRRAWRILGALPWGRRGGVLYRERVDPGPRDNFCTYPLLQLAAEFHCWFAQSRMHCQSAYGGRGRAALASTTIRTLLQYLGARIRRGVK
jgi:hypothetical protein